MRFKLDKDIYYSNCSGVFQGGGCKAIAYIGAYEVAYEHGIMFSELAGTSAGAIFAAAIALGATPQQLKDFVYGLDFMSLAKAPKRTYPGLNIYEYFSIKCSKLYKYFLKKVENKISGYLKSSENPVFKELNFSTLINEYGIFDSDILRKTLSVWFTELSGITDPSFKDLGVELHILAGDLKSNNLKEFSKSKTPNESIADAVTASCCIPIIFTPHLKRYVDGGILSNRPDILIGNKVPYFRKLSFSLQSKKTTIENVKQYVHAIINTILEGADRIQHPEENSQRNDRITIQCGEIAATDFRDMNEDKITMLIGNGRIAMEDFFNHINSNDPYLSSPHIHLFEESQLYSQIANWSYDNYDNIVVVCSDLNWVWRLFPTITSWCNNSIRLRVYMTNNTTSKFERSFINKQLTKGKSRDEAKKKYNELIVKESAIKRFLEAIGAQIINKPKDMPDGFFFQKGERRRAIVYKVDKGTFNAKIYMDKLDSYAIQSLMPKSGTSSLSPVSITIDKGKEVIEALQKIPMYKGAIFEWKQIKVDKLRLLNKFIRGEKYKQIFHMFNLYPENLNPFSPISVVLKDGHESLTGPIVVEQHGDNLFVIEGNTRVVFAYRHKINELEVLIIRNVSTPLPLDMQNRPKGYSVEEVRVNELSPEAENRYEGFDYSLFRPIEQTLRPDSKYLTE